jgi:hypothetical protein
VQRRVTPDGFVAWRCVEQHTCEIVERLPHISTVAAAKPKMAVGAFISSMHRSSL